MPNRLRFMCYICNTALLPRAMVRIIDNVVKQEVAVSRRSNAGRCPLNITDETRICNNCNMSIAQELQARENDPSYLRLNVLKQTSSDTCLICNARNGVHRLAIKCRINIFVHRDIYVPENIVCCQRHLDENGLLFEFLRNGLQFTNRLFNIKRDQLQLFLQALRYEVIQQPQCRFKNENDFTENQFKAVSPVSKQQFNELFGYCDPVRVDGTLRYISKKYLLIFLCKIRQGISDEFLSVIFNFPTRQAVSRIISIVRQSLMLRFVPLNIGFNAITRENYIERHVTPFSNTLYNKQPSIPRVIVCNDCTYLDIEKSSCFKVLRQSYCMHKSRHLVKPSMLVAPDGYILDIQGPYFSNVSNNDANILLNEFQRDIDGMRNWFQEGDIFVIDRGYRDATPTLQRMGLNVEMPSLLTNDEKQLTTEQANNSRIVTKTRWIVEARNGHLKSIFKFFKGTINTCHIWNLRDFLLIAGAIINKYFEPVLMPDATVELAEKMLQQAHEPNIVQARVEVENLRNKRGDWIKLNELHVPRFPRLTLDYLRKFTYGTYQVRLAPSYIQDNDLENREAEFQLDQLNEPGFMRVRIYSRFRNTTRHQLWIAYVEINDEEDETDPILGSYCTCQSGSRTLGTCSHITTVIWFLGYARHQENILSIRYPSIRLLDEILNAENAANMPMIIDN